MFYYLSLLISLLLLVFWIVCGVGILRAGKTAAADFPGSLLRHAQKKGIRDRQSSDSLNNR